MVLLPPIVSVTIEVNIKRDTRGSVPFELGKVLLIQTRELLEDEEILHSKQQVVQKILFKPS